MKRVLLILLSFFAATIFCRAQQNIKGIGCVTPGVEYDYRFNTGQDSSVSIQVCVTGGQISGSSSNCITALRLKFIKITWNENISNGLIDVSFQNSHLTKNVNIIPVLSGGLIDSLSKGQLININDEPADIRCTQAIGGGCNTKYAYQWQQSTTTLDWKDMAGAQDKNLKFSAPLTALLYFRRKVMETNSGSVAYSDAAAVLVNR